MNAAPIRVLVADDYAPMRLGVRALLEQHGFAVCAEAADAQGAVAGALRERPDLCLLDIRMPGDGIAAAARIAAALPETPIVMLTVSREEVDFLNALRAGAAGYVLKETDGARLPEALRSVLHGEVALPRALVSRLIDRLEQREAGRRVLGDLAVDLTAREHEVLDLLRDGMTTAQIAKRLFIAPVTVRSHISSIVRKLGVGDRDSALALLDRTQPIN